MGVKVYCLFGRTCATKDLEVTGCPFNLDMETRKKVVMPRNCSTWNFFRQSMKERRIAYAQEARSRGETARSKGQSGDASVRAGHKDVEVEAQEEIDRNVE